MMKYGARVLLVTVIMLLLLSSSVFAKEGYSVMSQEDFERWPDIPEYTELNPFPYKGSNCTWYAHGRMLQLGYSRDALNTMLSNARDWADDAANGAFVSENPEPGAIAFWDGEADFGGTFGYLGHVAVVEEVRDNGSILVSDSSSSGDNYNVREFLQDEQRWPTAFIIVPKAD
ncbi:MAG: CHAP domain-containing protein [Bacillota bacterium]